MPKTHPRLKTARFTTEEILKLLEEVDLFKHILLDRSKAKTAVENKKLCWSQIAETVSKLDAFSPSRTGDQCAVKFRDLKSECLIFKRNMSMADDGQRKIQPQYFNNIMDIIGANTTDIDETQDAESTNDNGSWTEEDGPGPSNGPTPDTDLPDHKSGNKKRHADYDEEEAHLRKNYIIKKTKLMDVLIEYYGLALKKLKKSEEVNLK